MIDSHILQRVVNKMDRRALLDDSDRLALLELPFQTKTLDAAAYLVREGMPTDKSCLIVSGFAARHKLTHSGARQIVSVHIAGDFVDLEASVLKVADHNIQTLTRCEVAMVPTHAILKLIDAHPMVARAMWADTLIDGSIFREWVLNVGRRNAQERIAHLICEFGRRLELAGLGSTGGFRLPLTQEQLADATGLTPVHVNRSLKTLEADGLIVRHRRELAIPDWQRLRDLAGFNERYLHLDQAA